MVNEVEHLQHAIRAPDSQLGRLSTRATPFGSAARPHADAVHDAGWRMRRAPRTLRARPGGPRAPGRARSGHCVRWLVIGAAGVPGPRNDGGGLPRTGVNRHAVAYVQQVGQTAYGAARPDREPELDGGGPAH